MKICFLSAVGVLALAGCVSVAQQKSTAQPFATLYGAREAQWLNNNHMAIFSSKNDPIDFHETEIRGFPNLDSNNQKLYLVVRFCTHQPGNAEDGIQMWRLMSELKCSKKELSQYISSLDRYNLKLYASYLRGSIGQFDTNSHHYLQ
jgi:hypothetical protein